MCVTRRDNVPRQVMYGSGMEGVAGREGGCEDPLEEGFSFGVCCAWWLDRCGSRGGCYHRTRLLALCSLRHPRMLGGAKGRVWGGEGNGGSLITACYLLLFFTYFKLNPTMYPTYHTISDYKRI